MGILIGGPNLTSVFKEGPDKGGVRIREFFGLAFDETEGRVGSIIDMINVRSKVELAIADHT